MKNTIRVQGFVENISDIIEIDRGKKGKLHKKVISLVTADGQKLFAEIRNKRIRQIDDQLIIVHTEVTMDILFQGSEKNGKRYNNLFIDQINRV